MTASVENGSRNSGISNILNPSSQNLNVQCSVTTDPAGDCNYNPLFAQYPVNIFCLGQNTNFSQGAIDLNGDSLVYTLVTPRTTGGAPITWTGTSTPGNPMGSAASVWNFDTHTGNINFTPTALGKYVFAVRVDAYRNGVVVGYTLRDIQFSVINCAIPLIPPALQSGFTQNNVQNGFVIDSNHVAVCPGQNAQITFTVIDTVHNSYIVDSTNVTSSLRGSTINVVHHSGYCDTAIITINWTPLPSDSGFHYFTLIVKDTTCPQPARQTYSFVVSILQGIYAGPIKLIAMVVTRSRYMCVVPTTIHGQIVPPVDQYWM